MITYLYWLTAFALAITAVVLGGKAERWSAGLISAVCLLFAAWLAYFFHFEQVFVKHYGGVMVIEVPKGQQHLSATWKDDHLWVENYDPKSNTCYFNEYSKGNLLQGKVVIKQCSPLKASNTSD